MYHKIEFTAELTIELETTPRSPLERLRIRQGTRLRAQLRPHVEESTNGPLEVADLHFEDGSTTRQIPFACFQFVE